MTREDAVALLLDRVVNGLAAQCLTERPPADEWHAWVRAVFDAFATIGVEPHELSLILPFVFELEG